MQLDVSVLDKNRHPVRGLAQGDFTILEDGKPRKIVGFASFDIGDDAAAVTGWLRDTPPDVTTNSLKQESRLFVIVIDDGLIPQDPAFIRDSKKIIESIIDQLGSNDLTAIVFTADNRKTQDFTNDKAKLRATLDKFNPGLASYRFGLDSMGIDGDLYFQQSAVRVLDSVTEYLAVVPQRRKSLFWISPGVPMDLAGAVPKDRDGCPATMPWDAGQRACRPAVATVPPLTCVSGSGPLTGPQACGGPMGVIGAKLPPFEMTDMVKRIDDAFRRAQRANVTIYPIDPTGLGGIRNYLSTRLGADNQGFAAHKATTQLDFLTMTAENTGGRTIINTNDFEPGIRDIFEENKSYYLITFEADNLAADGKLHRLQVKVNRDDVEVRTRSGYYAPQPEKPADKDKPAVSPEAAALAKSIGGLLPTTELPMRVAIAPFAVPGQRNVTVTVALGVRQPIPAAAKDARITENTELQISAFSPEGDPKGTQRHRASVTLRPGSDGEAAYEVLGKIDLPPGRYRLRLAAHNATSKKDGAVFADVIVPDYSNLVFSASPVILNASPGRVFAPRDLLSSVIPIVPTAEREFARDDKVTAFLRLYQSGKNAIERVQVTWRIRDERDGVAVDNAQTINVDQFTIAGETLIANAPISVKPPPPMGFPTMQPPGAAAPAPSPSDKFANLSLRTADVRHQIPIGRLPPGQYLLTVEATLGATIVRRDVRFSVR